MSAEYYYPDAYKSILSLEETEKAIADIKAFFQTYCSDVDHSCREDFFPALF